MDHAVSRTAERGSVSIEVAVLAPAFIALIVLAGVAGRTAVAAEAIDAAAHDAARAASISRDARTARVQARDAALRQLDWRGLDCAGTPRVTFSGAVRGAPTSFDRAFRSPAGRDASVTVRISCTVSYRDLHLSVLPGMPADRQVSASFTSPLDRYRSRALGAGTAEAGSAANPGGV
ncbi:pilus assembly protein [Micromonospora peucetia]|uniref:Pilus assembly protein n=1 Tax=Micromonospora peucetia TaxID=47871 RepID=A0A1C6USC4_9ACTN|nr:TadE/TadG family type IV pilus assembly protein [Micromonospora peucetia]MCX4387399.1 pilus assembly protein [Micromonospora peucetia]WSA34726.1 pilus assembly protein [Micromonospora peucetia]SCL56850.1 TadE-like protein [Micromonospora peucetia]